MSVTHHRTPGACDMWYDYCRCVETTTDLRDAGWSETPEGLWLDPEQPGLRLAFVDAAEVLTSRLAPAGATAAGGAREG